MLRAAASPSSAALAARSAKAGGCQWLAVSLQRRGWTTGIGGIGRPGMGRSAGGPDGGHGIGAEPPRVTPRYPWGSGDRIFYMVFGAFGAFVLYEEVKYYRNSRGRGIL
jgi:hypothetical protein